MPKTKLSDNALNFLTRLHHEQDFFLPPLYRTTDKLLKLWVNHSFSVWCKLKKPHIRSPIELLFIITIKGGLIKQ